MKTKATTTARGEDALWRRLIVTILSLVILPGNVMFLWFTLANRDYDSTSEMIWTMLRTYAIAIAGFVSLHATDLLLLTSTHNNMKRMRRAGYKPWQYWACALHTLLTGDLVHLLVMPTLFAHSPAHHDVTLLWHVVVALLASDYPFYLSHKWLHQSSSGSAMHALHHWCLEPSVMSNLFFIPGDLLIEFTAPVSLVVLLLGTNIVGMYDPYAAVVALAVQQAWYAMGHDSTLKMGHYRHHTHVDRNYFIYVQSSAADRADKVGKLVLGDHDE